MARSSKVTKFVAALGAVGAACAAAPAQAADTPGGEAEIQVIGGDTLTQDWQNPGAVLTTADGRHHCTGIRIAPRWVITARHCYNHPFENHTFNIDTVYTASVKAMQGPKAKVKKVHVAPTADTVLLELEEGSRGVILGWSDQRLRDGQQTEYYGWGFTAPFGQTVSKDLKRGKAKVTGYGSGNYHGGENVRLRGQSSCSAGGDSGGPFVSEGLAVGNLSWGMAGSTAQFCLMGMVPFAQNADWIKNTTGTQPNGGSYYYIGDR